MTYKKKSWKEKFYSPKEPKIVDNLKGRGKMLVPTPALVDEVIKKIPRGKLATDAQIRDYLAKKYGVVLTCPLATGWFFKIIAGKVEEELQQEVKNVTPYRRVIKKDGRLLNKKPEWWRLQEEKLKAEGHEILPSGGNNPPRVKDFEKKLVKL